MHRRARPEGGFAEWPNGRGVPPRVCVMTGFMCQPVKTVRITRRVVLRECGDCGRKWLEHDES
jgi:hypothetical protein